MRAIRSPSPPSALVIHSRPSSCVGLKLNDTQKRRAASITRFAYCSYGYYTYVHPQLLTKRYLNARLHFPARQTFSHNQMSCECLTSRLLLAKCAAAMNTQNIQTHTHNALYNNTLSLGYVMVCYVFLFVCFVIAGAIRLFLCGWPGMVMMFAMGWFFAMLSDVPWIPWVMCVCMCVMCDVSAFAVVESSALIAEFIHIWLGFHWRFR